MEGSGCCPKCQGKRLYSKHCPDCGSAAVPLPKCPLCGHLDHGCRLCVESDSTGRFGCDDGFEPCSCIGTIEPLRSVDDLLLVGRAALALRQLAFATGDHLRQTLCQPTDNIAVHIKEAEQVSLLLNERFHPPVTASEHELARQEGKVR